jgi:hypothetical protein
MAVQAEKEIFQMIHMLGDLAVKNHKDLAQEEKQIDDNAVSNDLGKGLNLFPARIKFGELAYEQAQQNQKRRPGSKGRRQKARSQDGG